MKEKIGFSSFPDFSGNCKALYEDLKNKKHNYELIWFCKDKNIAERLNKNGVKAIWDKSEEFENEFNNIKIVINTHDDYMNMKSENQIFINLWHGLGPKKGGILQEGASDWVYNLSTQHDYFIAPSEFGRFIFSSIFNIPLSRVRQFPQARYKWLFESNGRKNLEKVLKKELTSFKKIIMYAPTYKMGLGRLEANINTTNILNLNNYDEKVLIDYLEKNNILLVLKLHPSEENVKDKVKYSNIVILKDEDMLNEFVTINEILNGVDLLISDYSSVYIDYINLEKPIIFFDADKEEYQKNRGLYFDSPDLWWMAGPKVHLIEDFIIEAEKLFNDNSYYKKEREQFNKLVNGEKYRDNDELIKFICNMKPATILEKQKEQLEKEKSDLQKELLITREELDFIKYSRSYKLIEKIKKIIKVK